MTMENQNFELRAGNSRRIRIAVLDDQGQPLQQINSAEWILAKKEDSQGPDVLVRKPGSIVDGKLVFLLTKNDTIDIKKGVYFHFANVVDVEGNPSTVSTGTVTIKPSPR